MSLLVLEDVALRFGGRAIVDGLSLRVAEHDRVGLIGPNGSGKTTLLRIMAGDQGVDRGRIEMRRGLRIGYLPQDLAIAGGVSLRDFVLSSVPGRAELDREHDAAEAELAAAGARGAGEEEMLDLAEQLAEMTEMASHFERFFSEHEALRILAGLGFQTWEFARDIAELSGGWKMRAVLAALLFQQPDLLLLDEPTNHLDMPSVAWFSDFLRRYRRAFFLISHDREFLDEQIARVVSFEPEGVRQYSGNYAQYARQRVEEAQVLENAAANVARERERLQRFVDRFRAQATKARAVQSKVKALEKLGDVELHVRRRTMRLTFPPCQRAANEALRVEGVAKSYGDHVVFPGVDLSVRRGEKIAIIGPNGAGKTTLLRMMAGELAPDGGRVVVGGNVTVGYYAQHHADTLHRDFTVEQEVARANPDALPARVRAILGAFLFSGDDVDKKVAVLSGGERARVALARLLIRPGNLLLMDEPTNHLDLESSEELAESLSSFDGTMVFVSHNRGLVRRLATRIWNVADGAVETYGGTLDEYMDSCRRRLEEEGRGNGRAGDGEEDGNDKGEPSGGDGARKSRADERARRRREAEERRRRSARLGPITSRIESLEERIAELEKAQSGRGAELSDPAVYADDRRRRQLLGDYQTAQAKLEELTARWEAAHQELAALEGELAAEADGDAGVG
ncbi:MAG TPA: ABC-F family ATP-binding cassette domain-containing protein [Candidatus Acidoferrum sp.]|nr:ABC-F family ATP-binding cassette domain-containing protein [Candidatus Acidoferrum sp.]